MLCIVSTADVVNWLLGPLPRCSEFSSATAGSWAGGCAAAKPRGWAAAAAAAAVRGRSPAGCAPLDAPVKA
jgi:hypothetical protein